MSSERLQKILAQAGIASRRAAEKYITEGRVRVNGEVVSELGAKADPSEDTIEVDGMGVIEAEPVVYIVLHKPVHVVTTVSDPEGRQTVLDVLQMSRAEGRKTLEGNMPRVFPVGRLDFDAEGLLVLTNDGGLANDLLHPRYHVPKTYVVKVKGRPDQRQVERLRRGVRLREEDGSMSRSTAPADVNVVRESPSNTWLEMVIVEGRHHQVKRMCEAVGHQVLRLIRTEFGGIELGELEPGHWRFLSEGEVELLRSWRAGNASELLASRTGPSMTERLFAGSGARAGKRSGAPRERSVYRADRRSSSPRGERGEARGHSDRAPRGDAGPRGDRGPRSDRDARPSRPARGDFGARTDRGARPARPARGDAGGRGARDVRSSRPARTDFGARGARDARPARPARGDAGGRGARDVRPSRSPRGDFGGGAGRDARSSRPARGDFGTRGDRGARPTGPARGDFGARGDRGARPSRPPREQFAARDGGAERYGAPRPARRDAGDRDRGLSPRGDRAERGPRRDAERSSDRRPRRDGPNDGAGFARRPRSEGPARGERRGPPRDGQPRRSGAPRGGPGGGRGPSRGPRR